MSKHIIMMNGFTASGKSTTAIKIFNKLENVQILHTAFIRKELGLYPNQQESLKYKFELDDERFIAVSKIVYNEVLNKAGKILETFDNVILDATYNFKWQRQQVYEFAKNVDAHITIINCVCNDEEKIIKRLQKRKISKDDLLSEASEYETYLSTKKLAENVFYDKLSDGERPHILIYDSGNGQIRQNDIINCEFCNKVRDVL